MSAHGKTWLGFIFPIYVAIILVAVVLANQYSLIPPAQPEPISFSPEAAEPPDFAEISDIPERKDAFFGYFRPIIAQQNEHLRDQRAQVLVLHEQFQEQRSLPRSQQQQLRHFVKEFEVEASGPEAKIKELLLRVNEIPEALALAQAAAESGWGTSRFAREANNYFGQWCFRTGCGLVPSRRAAGARHEVATFDSPVVAVQAYFRNLNTFHIYEDFRQKRQQLAEQEQPLTAHDLVGELLSYSERGEHYIDELRAIIRVNDLE